jgi:uncharacterized damage-inducible protein DinB
MYRKLSDFEQAFAGTTEATGKVFAALTDKSLGQAVGEGYRTLGQLAWHLVTSYAEVMPRTGLTVKSVDDKSLPPASADAIRAGYAAVTKELGAAIKANWNDAALEVMDDMYGEQWPRGLTLSILLNHEIHHRGQMTVLMRQAGLKVPGVMGSSKEEWSAYGMEAPPY